MIHRLLISAFLFFLPICGSAATIATDEYLNEGLKGFLNGVEIEELDDFTGEGTSRAMVELVLLYQALKLGGYPNEINIIGKYYPHLRALKEMSKGEITMHSGSFWLSDAEAEPSIWVTAPIIQFGEYHVGLYTIPKNKRALAANSIEDIRKLKAVSRDTWNVDWNTLQRMKLNKIYNATSWDSIVLMLHQGRADFTLIPFSSNPSMERIEHGIDIPIEEGVKVVPIPGIKVRLTGSRHWAVSKNSENGEQAFRAIQKGLIELDRTGKRLRAFRECGLISSQTEHWKLLN